MHAGRQKKYGAEKEDDERRMRNLR